ncbi:hypothetical protein CHKEEEPN_0960 [Methylorubrum podarium]|nr:hypothetical protein CHKEEEPN_0960 [Methylorubrum podarium]
MQGAVTLAPGARLDIAHAAGQTQGRRITVLTATGDLTGDFTDAGGTTDLADGATFTDDGRRYRIAYQRAATGSSVTLTDLSAQPSPADLEASRRADFAAISGTSYLSQQTFPVGQRYNGWQIDGLSGIDYDPVSNTFITERDNAYGGGGPDSRTTPPYFTLKPVLAEDQPGYTVQFVGVTPLDVPGWTPATNSLESIRRDPTGDGVWLTSETPHTIYHVHQDGVTRDQLTLPATVNGRFAPGTDNYGLEGLTFTPDGGLWVIREDALQGDSTNLTRITHLNRDGSVVAQYAYPLDTVKVVANGGRTIANPPGAGVGNNGASELLALTNTSFLVLERAWDGIGANVAPTGVSHNSIRIYRIDLAGATDVAATTNLVQGDPSVQPVTKQLIFDSQSLAGTLNTYDTKIDNIEGMSSGPTLPDGHASLVLVSDSNARPQQRKTEFLVLKVQSPIPDEQNWDGTTAMADGFAGGGGGTWSASPGNENWTRADGLINDGWNGRIAAFSGPAGTVTVDATAGAVSASRLRFLSSGYQVGGAALTVADQSLQIEAAAGTQTAIAAPLAGGVGGLTLSGGGVLTLSGAETYTGATAVQAGTLLVDGSLAAASAVTVASGARLGGSGTVAGSLTSAGLLSAGDAGIGTGTLTTGALTLQAGATLQEDIDAVGKADTLAVQGAVTLAPGARLDVARAAGQAQGRRITVLTATGDLTGDFTDAGGTTDLADGTTFTDDGHQYRIAYQRAATGSSVTLIDLTLPPLEVRIDHLSGDSGTFAEDGPPVALDAGLDATVSDDNAPNFGGGTLTAQITANGIPGEDVLGFGGGVALSNGTQVGSGVSVDGVVVGTIAKTGSGGDPLAVNLDSDATPARVQALLRSLVYRNTNAADPGTAPRSVAVTVGDGVGGTSTAATVTVTVAAVNDPPVLSATPANPTFTEGAGPGVQGSAVAPFAAASVSTVEAGQTITGLTLTVGGLRDGADEVLTLDGTDLRLGAAAQGVTAGHGLSYAVSLSGDTATIALTGTAGVDGAVAAEIVTGLGYRDTRIDDPTAGTRTVTLTGMTDSGGGQDTSAPAIASTVTVVAVDDAPTATMPSGPVNAPEQVQTPVDGGLTVQDPDSKTLATATMAISGHYVRGQDSLAFAPDTALYGDIQGSFDAGSGVLQLFSAGGSTLAQWQAALRSVSYLNGSDTPDTAARTVSLTLNDGSLASVPVTTQVIPVPVNDAPTGTDKTITLRADAGVTITADDFGFTDPKDGPANGLKAVVIDTLPTSGSLTLDGVAVSAGQSIAAADLAAGKLRFLPQAGGTGGGQTGLTFQVQDDGGTANGGIDLDPTPKTLSFSILPAPSGGGWGDVHYYTFDGLRYDLQATGDFVITHAVSGAALEIQGRAEGTGGVSFLTAVSVRSGGHDVLFDEARPNAIEVDGKLLKLDVGARAAFGDLVVTRSADEAYRLVTGAGDGIGVIGHGTYMDIDVAPGAGRADGSFEGLLGNLDGDRSNDLALRDGTRLHDHAQALIEGVYADAWRATGPGALIAELGAGTLAERTAWYADHPDANALAVPSAHPGALGVTTT